VRLAASLSVPCAQVTAGILWDPSVGKFKLEAEGDEGSGGKRLGQNARRARREMNISQQALGARASMCRGDVVDFERGSRNFRIFTAVRLSGALGVDFADLFSGVANWHVRPLPAPEYGPGDRPLSKADQDAQLVRLWREGRSESDIAEALDLKTGTVSSYVRELRDAGENPPYRRPPRRSAESAARSRRARAGVRLKCAVGCASLKLANAV
jgi:transcriptional regulator with XRE-family HTH domain